MQRVLRKRVLRDLKSNLFRYLALGLMIAMGVFLVVTIVGSGETLTRGTEDIALKTDLEDGEFEVFVPLSDKQKEDINKMGVTLEEHFFLDIKVDESTIRVFKIRKDIDRIHYIEGEGILYQLDLEGICASSGSACTSGSLDPSVVTFIAEKEGLTAPQMSDLLNKKSGLLGVSGVSSDDRDVTAAEKEGNPRAKLAHEMLYYQIAQYVGSFYVALGGCDAIVFTAGLGENQPALREAVCNYLECLGVKLDKEANNNTIHGRQGTLTASDSKIRVELIATDEEMVIARDTRDIVAAL